LGTLTNGDTYQVSFNISGSNGDVYACLGVADCQDFNAGSGNVSFTGTWADIYPLIAYFTASSDFNGSISNVSVKAVTPIWTLGTGWTWIVEVIK